MVPTIRKTAEDDDDDENEEDEDTKEIFNLKPGRGIWTERVNSTHETYSDDVGRVGSAAHWAMRA